VDGGAFPHHSAGYPNVYALPVTIVLQITQYIRYLGGLRLKNPHRSVLKGLGDGGAQGFCVGLLGALTVSSSQTETDVADVAGISLRLAVCIGAYVDKDGEFGDAADSNACVALRWREDNLKGKDEVIALAGIFQDVGPHCFLSTHHC
jgi:hypothetical protein